MLQAINKFEGDPAGSAEAYRSSASKTVSLDVVRYQAFLDDSDVDDHQKEELLKALWIVITSLADLGYGVHPLDSLDRPDNSQVATHDAELEV